VAGSKRQTICEKSKSLATAIMDEALALLTPYGDRKAFSYQQMGFAHMKFFVDTRITGKSDIAANRHGRLASTQSFADET